MKGSKGQTCLLTIIWLQSQKKKKDRTSTNTSSFQSAGGDWWWIVLPEDESLADSNSECTEISEDQGRQKSRLDLDVSPVR